MAKRFRFPFAENGDRTAIQDVTQPSGIVNYQDGYPAAYSLDILSDPTARRVNRDRFNQLMFDATSNIKEWQEQSYPAYIQPSSNGGVNYAYPKGMTVRFNGTYRISLVDGNDTQPDNASNWADAFPLPIALGGTGASTVEGARDALGSRQATLQEALEGADVDAYTPPDLVHAAVNQYGVGGSDPAKAVDDLDTWDEKGIFNVTGGTNGWPFGNTGGVVEIYRHGSGNYFRQEARKASSIETKYRFFEFSSGWSGWTDNITTNNKATTTQAEEGTNDDTYLTPLKGKQLVDALSTTVRDFDTVGAVMLCVLSQTSNASTYPGSLLRGVTVGGGNTSASLTGTYRPLGFVLANSSDPLERTTVFQKIAE